MPISLTETGLTQDQYTALNQPGTYNPAFKMVAHRYNPDFTLHSTSPNTGDNLQDFEIIRLTNGDVLKAADGAIERWIPGTNSWSVEAGFSAPTGMIDTSMALVYSSGTVLAYACTLTGLQVNASSDNGVTWTGWSMFYGNPSGAISGYVYGTDQTAAQTFASTGTNHANAFDNNPTTNWTGGSDPNVTQYIQVTFGASKRITRYSITAPTDPALVSNTPRSWSLYAGAGTTLIHTIITDPWTPGETRYFTVQAAPLGLGVVNDTVWRISNIISHSGVAVSIAEIEMMETGTASVPEIMQVASGTPNRIHFIYKDTVKQINNFRVASWNGASWDVLSSEIWWPFDIESFQVCTLGDRDTLLIVSDSPGTTTATPLDDGYITKVLSSGGIFAFTYRDGYWSDHINVDVVDNLSNWRWREFLKAGVINDEIYALCYSSEGTEGYPVEGYRCYKSDDGVNWSMGDLAPFPETVGGYGAKLLYPGSGDYIYAFEKQKIYRSPMTLYFGSSPTSQQEDITAKVNSWSFGHSKAMQGEITLSNDGEYFTNHAIINDDNTVLLYHYYGGYIDGVKALMQIGISEIDSIDYDRQNSGGKQQISLTVRDKFAWMSDKTTSEQAIYRKSQEQGGDNYLDFSDSNRGGMGSTARQTGAWRTENGYLRCDSELSEAIVFQTMMTDIWNGSLTTACITTSNAATVYFGVVFRAIDASNMWYAVFKYSDSKIHLYERRDGVDTERAVTTGTYSWAAADLMRHFRVECRYANIKVYIASDASTADFDGARTWSLAINYNMDASRYVYDEIYAKDLSSVPFHRGYMGMIIKSSVRSRFYRTEVFDYSRPNTIERVFEWYSSLAKLQQPVFDKLYRPSITGWTLDSGLTLAAANMADVWDDGGLWNDGGNWQ